MFNKKIAMALLTGMMVFGTSVTAFAESSTPIVEVGTENASGSASITKNLELAEGITIPTADFSFTITSTDADAPSASIEKISYDSNDSLGTLSEGKYTVSKNAAITFGELTKPGEYTYQVTENAGNEEGITYSTENYTVRIYVANKSDGGFYIKTITAEKNNEKQSRIDFTNVYTKNASLKITKNTEGEMADKTKDFTFKIKFEKSATEAESVTEYTGKVGEEDVKCPIGIETEFQLHDGESLEFSNLPAGTRYVVSEVEEQDGYTPAVSVVENGVQGTTLNGVDGTDLASADAGKTNLVGENENSVTFTNTYGDVAITGIVSKNLPFILMISVAVVGFGLTVVLKRGRKSVR